MSDALTTPSHEPRSEVPASLTGEDILSVVRQNLGRIRNCAQGYAGPTPAKLILKWTILSTGFTTAQELANPELKGTSVETCVIKTIASWRFPAFEQGSIPVMFPVILPP